MLFQLDTGLRVVSHPFPHLVLKDLVPDDAYAEMRRLWPVQLMKYRAGRDGYRSQHSLYACEQDDYQAALTVCPFFEQFKASLQAPEFVQFVAAKLKPYTKNCLIDLSEGQFTAWDHKETRQYLAKGTVPRLPGRDDMYVRMDFEQSGPGYRKPAHVDAAHRWFSMVYYMEDAEEGGFNGGNLCLHERRLVKATRKYPPEHNSAILYPRRTDSWHSVDELTACEQPRKFLFCAASSTMPIWPRA